MMLRWTAANTTQCFWSPTETNYQSSIFPSQCVGSHTCSFFRNREETVLLGLESTGAFLKDKVMHI